MTRFWTTPRVVLTLATLGLALAMGLSGCHSTDQPVSRTGMGPNPTPQATQPSGISDVASPQPPVEDRSVQLPKEMLNARLQTVDGSSLKLADYSNKVVIVNLWATWCGPCRQEMPELVKISKEYKDRGLEVIGLTTQQNDPDEDNVRRFVRLQNVDYQIVWDDGTFTAPLVQIVNGRGVIPQSFVISRDGRVLMHFTGYNPMSTPTQMRQVIEAALSERT